MKKLKLFSKIFLILIFSFLCISLFSCKEKEEEIIETDIVFASLEDYRGMIKDKIVYITSIGQSIDVENLMVYVDYLSGIEYIYDTDLKVSDLTANAIVFCVVGCSIKGMADSGITIEEEKTRAKDFAKASNNGSITLITWHLGGMDRRGSTSDTLILDVIKGTDLLIFVKEGNSDYYLSTCAKDNNVNMYQIERVSSVIEPLTIFIG